MTWDSLMGGAFPDARGRYGTWGGRYVPEGLVPSLERLEVAAREALADLGFLSELEHELKEWAGRPTPLTFAPRLSERWGADIWLKREDLLHSGAHTVNNALGQALLARRMGARRVVAATGTGQHGVSVAAACARVGLDCTIFVDGADAGSPRLARMALLGASVSVAQGEGGARAAASDAALRAWARDPKGVYYLVGSAVGPHPYPWLVRELQVVAGREAKDQLVERTGVLPDVVVASVGGGGGAIGLFHPFLRDAAVTLLGIEGQAEARERTPGVLHGAFTLVRQDADGQILAGSPGGAGLAYPALGPEHALLGELGRARYEVVDADAAAAAREEVARDEGILVALETAHALAGARRFAEERPGAVILVGCSGRGQDAFTDAADPAADPGSRPVDPPTVNS